MLPLRLKIVMLIVTTICSVISYMSAGAGWYRDCLKVSKTQGYHLVLLPVYIGLVIGLALVAGLLPWSLTEEVWALGSLIGFSVLVYATYKQVRGECTVSCPK